MQTGTAQLAIARDGERERQRQLDENDALNARLMLEQLGLDQHLSAAAVRIAARWLKRSWSEGWRAAGGPSGAPGVQGTSASAREAAEKRSPSHYRKAQL